jgi:hypothetical protein
MKTTPQVSEKSVLAAAPQARSLLCLAALALGAGRLLAADGIDLKTVTVKASAWEQKARGGVGDFPAEATLDGSLAPKSSWRAEGDGQWIEYNLGASCTLSGVQLAFLKGDARQYRFDVLVSNDAEPGRWQPVLSAQQSSGKSAALEAFSFAPVAVRHLRIVGHGNTEPKFAQWINLLEVAFTPAPAKSP